MMVIIECSQLEQNRPINRSPCLAVIGWKQRLLPYMEDDWETGLLKDI